MLSLAPMDIHSETAPIIRQPEPLSPDSRCLLLMSGGVESSTLLFHLARQEHPQPIFLDYAQRAARQEWQAVQRLSAQLRVLPQRYDLSAFGNAVGALRSARYHVPLPHRNFVAIAAVASIASNLNIKRVVIGLSADDAAVDACSRPTFQSAIHDTLSSLGLQLETPLIHLGKDAIIQYGNDLGVPWSNTYSCLLGRTPACGFCPQCLKRKAAFALAGVKDPDMRYDN